MIGKRCVVNGVQTGIKFKNEKGTIVGESKVDYAIKFDRENKERMWPLDGKNCGWYVRKDKVTILGENMITEKNIGRRVVVNGECDSRMFDNEKGKIIGIASAGEPTIAVRFDNKKEWMHGCGEFSLNCEDWRGWFVYEKNITFEKENKMTGIRIETEKIVKSDGKLCRKITGFKVLSYWELPDKYRNGLLPIVYATGAKKLEFHNRVKTGGTFGKYYEIGEVVPEDKFQKMLEHCRLAGDHLMYVNRELKKKKAEWNGKETFVI